MALNTIAETLDQTRNQAGAGDADLHHDRSATRDRGHHEVYVAKPRAGIRRANRIPTARSRWSSRPIMSTPPSTRPPMAAMTWTTARCSTSWIPMAALCSISPTTTTSATLATRLKSLIPVRFPFAQMAALGLGARRGRGRSQCHSCGTVRRFQGSIPVQVAAGRQLYAHACASCHGVHLEGQAHWDRPGADGYFPAPPHDATGHTWASDAQLHELTAHSVYAYAAPGSSGSPTAAFAGTLVRCRDRRCHRLYQQQLATSLQAYQRVLNPQGIHFNDLPPGWKFPPTRPFHGR